MTREKAKLARLSKLSFSSYSSSSRRPFSYARFSSCYDTNYSVNLILSLFRMLSQYCIAPLFFLFFLSRYIFLGSKRIYFFRTILSLNISSVPKLQLQDATRLVGIQSRMTFYKCKFLIKVGVGLQIRKEAKFPQCRSFLRRTTDGRGPGWNGRWKKVRMGSAVTKELMRGESRARRLPDMHNSVWFEICIRTWWVSLTSEHVTLGYATWRAASVYTIRIAGANPYFVLRAIEPIWCASEIKLELLMFNVSRKLETSRIRDEEMDRMGCSRIFAKRYHVASSSSSWELWL